MNADTRRTAGAPTVAVAPGGAGIAKIALASLALVAVVSGGMAADPVKPDAAVTATAKVAPSEKIDLSRQRQTLEHLDHRMPSTRTNLCSTNSYAALS